MQAGSVIQVPQYNSREPPNPKSKSNHFRGGRGSPLSSSPSNPEPEVEPEVEVEPLRRRPGYLLVSSGFSLPIHWEKPSETLRFPWETRIEIRCDDQRALRQTSLKSGSSSIQRLKMWDIGMSFLNQSQMLPSGKLT